MRFGLLILQSQFGGQPELEIYRQTIEQVKLAEDLGFSTVWLTEQHFNNFGICPDPLAFAATLAGVTRRIRLGTGVVVLPLHNPVTIAERAAMVDQLSEGRLDLGIGKGHPKQRFDVFGLNVEENEARFFEAHKLLLKAWKDENLTFEGDYYKVDGIRIVPRTFQKPHPPLWIPTFGNPNMISFAARHGYPILHSAAGNMLLKYQRLYEQAYNDHSERINSIVRLVYLRKDGAKARREMRRPARWYLENNPGKPANHAGNRLAIYELIEESGLVGSPKRCVERIRELEENHSINYFIGVFGPGGIPHKRVIKSMRLFGDKVMSEFPG